MPTFKTRGPFKTAFTRRNPAALYEDPNESIVNFSWNSVGGLISASVVDGELRINLYRLDPEIRVLVEGKEL